MVITWIENTLCGLSCWKQEIQQSYQKQQIQLNLRNIITSQEVQRAQIYQQFNKYLQSILSMDIEQFIDQANQFSFHYDQSNVHQVPLELYSQDSNLELSQHQNSVDQVLTMMMTKQSLVDKPLNQIISQALSEYNLNPTKVKELTKKARKTKNILKRNRAKNRIYLTQKSVTTERKQLVFDQSSTQKDVVLIQKQIKKQRNRISAQISRDRKKNYVSNLEQKNKQLSLQSEHLKLQNQKLRKQISQRFINQNQNKKGKVNNNRFLRLLVLLGIVFFVYLLKDIFNYKASKSNNNMYKFNKQSQNEQKELQATRVLSQNGDIVEQIRNQIQQIQLNQSQEKNAQIRQGSLRLKQAITKKIAQIIKKTKQLLIPSKLAFRLIQAKNMLQF